ncbi:MAG: TetR family transcriptional regulator [Slackia sp.]|nr:TetR family transcriptional regulator [Slackia sp.]
MGSADTMKLIGDAFVELAAHRPVEKISVSDVVSASGKNRKTFYYHFEDKSHLIRWIFRDDMARTLRGQFEENQLVYESETEGSMPDLPYYTFKKTGIRSLDGSQFVCALATTLQEKRGYYAKVLRSNAPDSLRAYLIALYTPALEHDIDFILSNRSLNKEAVRFLARFYAGGLVTYLADRLADPSIHDILSGIGPFDNIIHDSIEHEIKEQQFRRVF